MAVANQATAGAGARSARCAAKMGTEAGTCRWNCQRRPTEAAAAYAAAASQPGQCEDGTGAAADAITRQSRWPAADGRAVAGALAGMPDRAQKLDPARLCRARAPVP